MICKQGQGLWIYGSLIRMEKDIDISHSIISATKMARVIRGDIPHLKRTSSRHNFHLKKRTFDSFRRFHFLGFYSIREGTLRYQQIVLRKYSQSTDLYVDD